ncbi:MAG TPA: glucose-1-phosphate adenylyltransferase, partial [Gammaproteobacteria bacterium]|nr:glucose-1-phosphate adenylyltransferase [Gammaproteobacteria bacterium]
ADAVFQNMDIIEEEGYQYILVLAGDHVYKMNYETMLQEHIEKEADMTVGCIEVPTSEATQFGVMEVEQSMRIVAFEEKPEYPVQLS